MQKPIRIYMQSLQFLHYRTLLNGHDVFHHPNNKSLPVGGKQGRGGKQGSQLGLLDASLHSNSQNSVYINPIPLNLPTSKKENQ